MRNTALNEKLIGYIQDAHAMERNVLNMLDSMISTTTDAETLARLKQHRQETEHHEQLLQERLDALGQYRSMTSEVAGVAAAFVKGVSDQMRADKPGKNARDAYVTEHNEIACYELLERLALRAGDGDTARVARGIKKDEEAMAEWIAMRWDRFVDLTLNEAGILPATTLQV